MQANYPPIDLLGINWSEALTNLSSFPAECLSQKKHVTCPICNTPKAFRFSNYRGEGNWICKSCGSGKGPRLIHEVLGLSYAEVFAKLSGKDVAIVPIAKRQALPPVNELSPTEVRWNKRLLEQAWTQSFWMRRNDACWRYLCNRVPFVDLTRVDRAIRLHRKMELWDKKDGKRFLVGIFPTMLAVVTDPAGPVITMHRTFLTNNGTKADLEEARMQMGGVRKLKGAATHIVAVPECRTLAVGEGYETMLAVAVAHHYQVNVRSYLNAGNLAQADIPRAEFDKVIIYADHDKIDVKRGHRPGTHAAEALAKRLIEMGFSVEIRLPKVECTDWADVWMAATNQLGNLIDRLVTRCLQEESDDPFKIIAQMLEEKTML